MNIPVENFPAKIMFLSFKSLKTQTNRNYMFEHRLLTILKNKRKEHICLWKVLCASILISCIDYNCTKKTRFAIRGAHIFFIVKYLTSKRLYPRSSVWRLSKRNRMSNHRLFISCIYYEGFTCYERYY